MVDLPKQTVTVLHCSVLAALAASSFPSAFPINWPLAVRFSSPLFTFPSYPWKHWTLKIRDRDNQLLQMETHKNTVIYYWNEMKWEICLDLYSYKDYQNLATWDFVSWFSSRSSKIFGQIYYSKVMIKKLFEKMQYSFDMRNPPFQSISSNKLVTSRASNEW